MVYSFQSMGIVRLLQINSKVKLYHKILLSCFKESVASFPGPSPASVACSTVKWELRLTVLQAMEAGLGPGNKAKGSACLWLHARGHAEA